MKLSSLFVELPKSKLPAATANIQGAYPFFVSGSDIKRSDEFIFDGEAVILSTGGNAVIHFGQGCFAYSTDCWTLEPKKNEVYPLYLYQWLLQKQDQIDTLGFEGSGLRHLKKNYVRNLEIDLPELAEQTKIAEILSCIDTAIEQTEAMIAKQQRIKTGLMQDLLAKGIDEHGNIRSEHTHAFKDSPLGRIPEEWEYSILENQCVRVTDGTHQQVKTTESGVPFLYVSCVRKGVILWESAAMIDLPTYEIISKGREPKQGVILYTVVGSYGYAALVETDKQFSFQRHIAYILPNQEKLHPKFLMEWMSSERIMEYADSAALGNAQKTITLGELRKFPLLIPEKDEQEKIVQCLSKQNLVIEQCSMALEKLRKTKTALMQDLLSGKVRVNQLIQ